MAILLGRCGFLKYKNHAVTIPASASQNGGATTPCAMNAQMPWYSSVGFCMKSVNTTLPISQPAHTEGIASSTSGTVTTGGDSCGGCDLSKRSAPWNAMNTMRKV